MKRGDVYLADLAPVRGREQDGTRPVLLVSQDKFNALPFGLVVVLPITSKERPNFPRVKVLPREGGLTMASWIICEQPRTISVERLVKRLGAVSPKTLATAWQFLLDIIGP
ncbi:MAG: type II toxin-antitoxin system PemK/MazF family toxin [Myxococcales bacterium]